MFLSIFRKCCRSTTAVNDQPSPMPYTEEFTRWKPSLSSILEDEGIESDHPKTSNACTKSKIEKKKIFNQIVKDSGNSMVTKGKISVGRRASH